MPIIIDEVVISVEVAGGPPGAGGSSASSGDGASGTRGARESAAGGADKQGIVEECVERVLDVLRRREER